MNFVVFTCGEAYRSRRAFDSVVRRASFHHLWLRLGHMTSSGKVDSLRKI